jgi:hypothetical protein
MGMNAGVSLTKKLMHRPRVAWKHGIALASVYKLKAEAHGIA